MIPFIGTNLQLLFKQVLEIHGFQDGEMICVSINHGDVMFGVGDGIQFGMAGVECLEA
jgi:hypothetical protein